MKVLGGDRSIKFQNIKAGKIHFIKVFYNRLEHQKLPKVAIGNFEDVSKILLKKYFNDVEFDLKFPQSFEFLFHFVKILFDVDTKKS